MYIAPWQQGGIRNKKPLCWSTDLVSVPLWPSPKKQEFTSLQGWVPAYIYAKQSCGA